MLLRDLLYETKMALTANKVRSGLTTLGIIIGIASVIAMVSIGQGAQKTIQTSIEGLGSNLLTIMPGTIQPGRGIVSSGRGSATSLKIDDANALRTIAGIANVSPEINRRFQVVSTLGYNTNTTVIGVLPDYVEVRNVAIENGSFIADSHERNNARVAVLGSTATTDLFSDNDPLGATIRIGKMNFKVIGTLASKGSAGFFNPDDTIFVPLGTMSRILTGNNSVSNIAVSVVEKNQMTRVKDEAIATLAEKHRVDPLAPDFSIVSQADIIGTLSQVTLTFTLFLASVASISLIVGGIGIMNMMLTTVTERTREIGLRKALGAKRRDISFQFLAESVALTFFGGFVGILLGWFVALAVSRFAGIATQVSPQAVALAFGVSAIIGIIFGYYPAKRAAALRPIEALRYE